MNYAVSNYQNMETSPNTCQYQQQNVFADLPIVSLTEMKNRHFTVIESHYFRILN
ncbi:MAG: hypothetical protein ACI9FN_002435 [Saprospiraceae bacterium]|jgi:hypothetical protein